MTVTRELDKLSWKAVERYLAEAGDLSVALVPVGAVEAHGEHAPLGTDHFISQEIALRIAERVNALVFPRLPLGVLDVGYVFDYLPGSVGVRAETLAAVATDVGCQLARGGFRRVVFVNGHGPNTAPLTLAAFNVHRETQAQSAVIDWWTTAGDIITEIKGFNYGNHADRIETSLVLTTSSAGLVDLTKAVANSQTLDGVDAREKEIYLKKIPYTHRFDERWVGTSGNMGDPSLATAKDGERIVAQAVGTGVQVLEVLERNLSRAEHVRAGSPTTDKES
ncbi:MAG: arfB [Hyphomicrobiales bacterium]|nr:arfB [Hyphomicrobiales bacterium]